MQSMKNRAKSILIKALRQVAPAALMAVSGVCATIAPLLLQVQPVSAQLVLAQAEAGNTEAGNTETGNTDFDRAVPSGHRRKPNLDNAFAFVEFFTSDNCVRCKEATDVAKAIDARARDSKKKIFLLSFHVDYLNNELWKDRLATPEFSERQKQYAKQFRQRKMAPGAVVVNAKHYEEGNDLNGIEAAISAELARKPVAVVTAILKTDFRTRAATVEYSIKGIQKIRRPFFTVGIALAEPVTEQVVASGNNAGVAFRHVNSVRLLELQRVGSDGAGTAELQIPDSMSPADAFAVVFVQDPQNNTILGAGKATVSGETELPESDGPALE